MELNTEEIVKRLSENLSNSDYIRPADIPGIDLYMDQVTTFMDKELASTKRYPEDKILTKTMINNYAKNNLLPPPVKKKYSKEHILVLVFIYYFKNLLSIKDIETLLNPVTEKFFQSDLGFDLTSIYREVFESELEEIPNVQKDILSALERSGNRFQDAPETEREFLKLFSFICTLSFDVYIKKQLIERLIDEIPSPVPQKKKKS